MDLLFEEFEGDLGNDALEHPVWLLVESFDLAMGLSWSDELGRELCLQNLAEKLDPGSDSLGLQKVRSDLDLWQKLVHEVRKEAKMQSTLILSSALL